MHIQMIPRAIFMLVGRSIQEHDFTLVPSLIRFADVCQIQWCSAKWWVGWDLWHASLISLATVRRIVLIPDVNWCLLALLTAHHRSINHIVVGLVRGNEKWKRHGKIALIIISHLCTLWVEKNNFLVGGWHEVEKGDFRMSIFHKQKWIYYIWIL